MPHAYLISACRTPIGKYRGALSTIPAPDLGATVVAEAVKRAGVAPADINEVILGNVLSAGLGQAPARQAALRAGLPPTVAALTINKVCGSGLKAVMLADQAIRAGDANLIVAGGMESMSRAPLALPRDANLATTSSANAAQPSPIDTMIYDGLTCAYTGKSMGEVAEDLARRLHITRDDQDRFALESHHRAVAAAGAGAFATEMIAVPGISLAQDEGPRRDTSLERLAKLKPSFSDDGTVTAGNSSIISDGAAAVVVASEAVVQKHRLQPLARIIATATSGGEPQDVFTAPVEAIREVIAKARHSLSDVDLFELNEAFAVQMLACMQALELPADRVNVHGGAIALGHPIGASGARVLVTLLHTLARHNKRTGVAALCLGGGNAVAMLVERPW